MVRLRLCAALAATVIATPVSAWEEFKDEPDTCGFGQTFEDGTTFLVSQRKNQFDEGEVAVGFFNDKWSVKKSDKLTDTYKVTDEGGGWFSSGATALDNGFVMFVPHKHFTLVADERPALVKLHKGRLLIGEYNMDGFSIAMLTFNGCRQKWIEAKAEAARLKSLERFPKDPFSIPQPPAPTPRKAPVRRK